ncbi:hypothetical protein LshimejAT787_2200640 [Lyophyllum shimeji]|uniref:Uncharacterized protein n=1 Tax=Lyophyllum shimeji TaxID=47721 RepID=A0A9P3UWS4_LYOSH|nr:hypothetical protein LshimejAT787_2200640 [Lyophyllum shimeji]
MQEAAAFQFVLHITPYKGFPSTDTSFRRGMAAREVYLPCDSPRLVILSIRIASVKTTGRDVCRTASAGHGRQKTVTRSSRKCEKRRLQVNQCLSLPDEVEWCDEGRSDEGEEVGVGKIGIFTRQLGFGIQ